MVIIQLFFNEVLELRIADNLFTLILTFFSSDVRFMLSFLRIVDAMRTVDFELVPDV